MTTAALALLLLQAPSFEGLAKGAQAAHQAGRNAEAIALYRQALKLKPDWPSGWWGLGALEYASDQYNNCRAALSELTRLDPKAPAGWALRGICDYKAQDYPAAGEHLFRARSLAKGASELSRQADFYYALLLTRGGAFEPALSIFAEQVRAGVSDAALTFAAGIAALRIKALPPDVREADREVVAMAGDAFIASAKQAPEEAAKRYGVLLEKHSRFPGVHFLYGTWLGIDNPEAARAEYLKELEVNPKHVSARVRLALLDTERGELATAVKLAREATSLDPQFIPAWLALARASLQADQPQSALQAALRARDLDPESPQIRLLLMSVYRAMGRTADVEREQQEFQRLGKR